MTDTELLQELKKVVETIKQAKDDTEKVKAQLEAVNILAQLFDTEAKETVRVIESKPETTQGHYGDYLAVLSGFNGLYRYGFLKALKNNGADWQGIEGALSIINQ